jgi:hypothetical protein
MGETCSTHGIAGKCTLSFFLIFNYALQPLRLIVRSGLDVPTFATRRLHACHHARAPSGGRWNCGRKMSGKFCLNGDFYVTCWRSFTCRKGTTWDRRTALLFLPRVRTRELVYQRPARYLQITEVAKVLTKFNWKTRGKIALGGFKLRCHNNIKMD